MTHIIVKNYEHFNTSLPNWNTPKGVYIKTKDQYDRALKESGMVSYDKMQQNVEKKKEKEYNLSEKGRAIIEAAKNSKDKHGKIHLSDRTIDAMKEIGAIGKKIPDYMGIPQGKGGFYESTDKKRK